MVSRFVLPLRAKGGEREFKVSRQGGERFIALPRIFPIFPSRGGISFARLVVKERLKFLHRVETCRFVQICSKFFPRCTKTRDSRSLWHPHTFLLQRELFSLLLRDQRKIRFLRFQERSNVKLGRFDGREIGDIISQSLNGVDRNSGFFDILVVNERGTVVVPSNF